MRNKVHDIAVKTWKRHGVEQVGLYRAFNRLFNRLLSNRGQGLWDCLTDNRFITDRFHNSSVDRGEGGAETVKTQPVVQRMRI